MAILEEHNDTEQRDWQPALPLAELKADSVRLVRVAGKQIAMFATEDGVRACDNRCPHEGYPLSEGIRAFEHAGRAGGLKVLLRNFGE